MTPSDLKYYVTETGSHFFERSSMKFFGDTMSNYGVRSKPVTVESYSGPVECWELYRKRPVKHGLSKSAFFAVEDYRQVLSKED
jgi:hypothetical protein